jgi:hypothetical protein
MGLVTIWYLVSERFAYCIDLQSYHRCTFNLIEQFDVPV